MVPLIRVSVYALALAIGWTLASRAIAQPQSPPPKRYSADEAAKLLGGPTLITLRAQQESAVKIVQSIAEQAGMSIRLNELESELGKLKPLSVELEKQPLWMVLHSLSESFKLNFTIWPGFPSGETDWQLLASNAAIRPDWQLHTSNLSLSGPAYVAGPVVVVVRDIARHISPDATGKTGNEQRLTVELLVLIDPKLKPRYQNTAPSTNPLRGTKIDFQASDGVPLTSLGFESNWVHEPKMLSQLVWSVHAWARLPAAAPKQLAKLRGELGGLVTTLTTERWQIDDVLNAKEQKKTVGANEFVFRFLKKNAPGDYNLRLASFGQGEVSDFGWPARTSDDRIRAIRLLNSAGQRMSPQAWFNLNEGTVNFRPLTTDPEPTTLIWELPSQVGEIEIPFEFTNLPLP